MTKKKKDLIFGILLDAVGYASYVVPVFGEGIDIIWAPLSAYIMIKMYEGKTGVIGGAVELIEEALPFTDFVPTYTLMWIYKYVIKGGKIENDSNENISVIDK